MKEIVDSLKGKILVKCERIEKDEELLGIEIDHYYDGENINLSASVKFFKENHSLISKGESRNEHISLIDNSNIDNLLEKVCSKRDLEMNKKNEMIKLLTEDLCRVLKKIKWDSIGSIAEEFYIDLLLNYD